MKWKCHIGFDRSQDPLPRDYQAKFLHLICYSFISFSEPVLFFFFQVLSTCFVARLYIVNILSKIHEQMKYSFEWCSWNSNRLCNVALLCIKYNTKQNKTKRVFEACGFICNTHIRWMRYLLLSCVVARLYR